MPDRMTPPEHRTAQAYAERLAWLEALDTEPSRDQLQRRPGRVVDEFAVPIERPRRIDSAPVAELAARITDRLREEMSGHGR